MKRVYWYLVLSYVGIGCLAAISNARPPEATPEDATDPFTRLSLPLQVQTGAVQLALPPLRASQPAPSVASVRTSRTLIDLKPVSPAAPDVVFRLIPTVSDAKQLLIPTDPRCDVVLCSTTLPLWSIGHASQEVVARKAAR